MESSPNDKLVPYYDGEEIVWITPPEALLRDLGRFVIKDKDDA